ncbi:malto-oligosyltrehalose synthase [Erwiniaceae bacterium BAC15a-03b]|uniref:Malto-oligosyltrehalose synthase n=1 Tax=Winslowiella arboricola TaxID=2978220 RepID=A0A9J6PWD2_9GAMM|nr:malto-oligosyltrehalose synthase [Winslowiella arboricola]MCU5774827.1 malto-oligosyltrehalose synthase [Winslowiella arboricola]MCU5780021.1 malto-oligosyltrehalose synthase [Winslowiella arboricola]
MKIPGATYRIQFRNGMTFDRAAELVPYLHRLGITHLYASPIFTATTGSTHGYDVTDVNQIEPSIGGRPGFDRMVKALHGAGLGLILDIVPNHMAASLENAWWRDVIENGENSHYARHFDIDWSRRLTLPFLGDSFEALLANGDIAVKPDPNSGRPAFACYESFYPLTPASWQGREADVFSLTDKAQIAELHDRQPWRLMSWRDASHDLSYRRFFEVTGLVGMRVEDRAVFDDTHRLILELVDCGAVDGLRVDHIDGLADPKAYLDLLRRQTGSDCYITVEKILGEGEQLPPEWPISGTTGYEFMSAVTDALVDGAKIDSLRKAYEAVVGRPVDMKAELRAAKLLMVDKNFAGEFATLLKLAIKIASIDALTSDEKTTRAALRELLIAFPVYRSYGTPQGMTAADNQLLQKVANKVKTSAYAPDTAALDFLIRILAGEVSTTASSDAATFRTRFQQLTGPLMAKSVEDTLFYRQNMALALNEVGAEPVPTAFSLDRFHAEMKTRLQRQPDALSGTSTHDTKRGEDARARLCTLTEAPQRWAECIARWREMNHASVKVLIDGVAPKPVVEWMLYQALAGVWPTTLQPTDEAGLKALEERFVVYVEKALREAKQRTNWGDSNDAYEQAVIDYARQLLSPANQTFLQDFAATLQPFIRAGLVNSLTQTIVKLTAPGVPDIYQGSEALDFSLVDPDNRREPDFAALARQLAENEKPNFTAQQNWLNGRLNQHIIARLLRCRQHAPTLFRYGDYLPLAASGQQAENVLAFARTENDAVLIVIAPRLMFAALEESPAGPFAIRWPQTEIPLAARLANRRYRDILTGEVIFPDDRINLALFDGSAALVLLSE